MNNLYQKPAPPAFRGVAVIIDWFLLGIGLAIIYGFLKSTGIYNARLEDSGYLTFYVLPAWLYHFLMEQHKNGQSLGKKLMGIRVVDLKSGQNPSIKQSLLRQVAKPIDWILFGLVATGVMYSNKERRRVGDLWANTRLIWIRPGMIDETAYHEDQVSQSHADAAQHPPIMAAGLGFAGASSQVASPSRTVPKVSQPRAVRLKPRDIEIIEQLLNNASMHQNEEVVNQAVEKVRLIMRSPVPSGDKREFLRQVVLSYNILQSHQNDGSL